MVMWKQPSSSAPAGPLPDQNRPRSPISELSAPTSLSFPAVAAAESSSEQSIFSHGITVRGEISGPDAIYVDGTIQGEINIPGERVTVGPHGSVIGTSKAPCITAREIVVLGTVKGNLVATDRLEIRANGSVTGDVSTFRLKIEDGSFFQGGIDIRKPELNPEQDFEQARFSHSSLEFAAAEA